MKRREISDSEENGKKKEAQICMQVKKEVKVTEN